MTSADQKVNNLGRALDRTKTVSMGKNIGIMKESYMRGQSTAHRLSFYHHTYLCESFMIVPNPEPLGMKDRWNKNLLQWHK